MASVTNPLERIRLLKSVESSFARSGWATKKMGGFEIDFEVSIGRLFLVVKCMDETRILYASPSDIVPDLEGQSRKMRNLRNRQLVVVLDREFLGVPLSSLIERDIFAITLDDLPLVVGLAKWQDAVPEGADPRQQFLLERCIEYAVAVSRRCRERGDLETAVIWARYAVRHSVGFTQAYYFLFNLLKDAGDFDGAAEIAEEIRKYRPDDPQFLRSMADLERRRGDKAAAARWTARLAEEGTTPRNIHTLLAKQRQQRGLSAASRPQAPAEAPKSALARLLSGFKRSARHED